MILGHESNRRIVMREQSRVFGNNLQLYVKRAGLGIEEFAEKLGYTAAAWSGGICY